MNITAKEVELLAPNADAAKHGLELSKTKLSNLCKSADGTLIFGECAGSGKSPYYCSADYLNENAPVFRCSCPSRQIPCKHVLGLLYACSAGKDFKVTDIPENIISKRAKIEQRQEKKEKAENEAENIAENKAIESPVNSKAHLSALAKKAEAQLAGVEIAEKLLRSIVQSGLSSVDAHSKITISEQVKQLGNYYIGGIQTAFNDLLLETGGVKNDRYVRTIDKVNYIYALLKKSREYFTAKKENPEYIELNSPIEEQTGYAWKLTELMQHGLYKDLYVYPGDINPRARWDKFSIKRITPEAMQKANSFAAGNYAGLVKTVKSSMKNPLMDKNPVALIQLHKASLCGNHVVLEDESGNKLTLKDSDYFDLKVENTLQAVLSPEMNGFGMAVMFENNIESGLFSARPLAILTRDKIIRLLY